MVLSLVLGLHLAQQARLPGSLRRRSEEGGIVVAAAAAAATSSVFLSYHPPWPRRRSAFLGCQLPRLGFPCHGSSAQRVLPGCQLSRPGLSRRCSCVESELPGCQLSRLGLSCRCSCVQRELPGFLSRLGLPCRCSCVQRVPPGFLSRLGLPCRCSWCSASSRAVSRAFPLWHSLPFPHLFFTPSPSKLPRSRSPQFAKPVIGSNNL